jgi:oligopeptidase B
VLATPSHRPLTARLPPLQYEDEGKLLAKKNTFSDFIACAEHLVAAGWADRRRIGAMGASAGGLLMGAVVNARPDLWAAIVSQVRAATGGGGGRE